MTATHHLGGFEKPTELADNERRRQCALNEMEIPRRRIGDSWLKKALWAVFLYGWFVVGFGAFFYLFIL